MSAIFGLYGPLVGRDAQDLLVHMDAALAAHGATTAAPFVDEVVGLGHRSRPFTPEDAQERQPITEGPLTLVCDGRLDNRDDLVQALGLDVAHASTLSDAALVLRAFGRWGEACLERLVGPFALAVWDRSRRRLFAARSQFGGRMLFVHHSSQGVAFATGVAALLALPHVERRLDEAKLAGSLSRGTADPRRTFFAGIERLLPGHCLIADPSGIRTERYWTPDTGRRVRFARDEDYLEAFVELYERVVAAHLRADAPAALMLSGGLDSASIAAIAAPMQQARGQRLLAYTEAPHAGFDRPVFAGYRPDESAAVRSIAEALPGLDSHLMRSTHADPFAGCEQLFELAGAPPFTVPNLTWYDGAISAAGARGARVMLTGEGGNLTISWAGPGLIDELLRERRFGRLAAEVGAEAARDGAWPTLRWLAAQAARRGSGTGAAEDEDAFTPARADFLRSQPPAADLMRHYTPNSVEERYAVLVMPDMGSAQLAALTALHDVDVRLPLVDRRLVEFCLALPEAQQRRAGVGRWLVRRAMAGRLPASVVTNEQRGLQAADWFATLHANRESIAADLDAAHPGTIAGSVLDVPRLQRLLAEMPLREDGDRRLGRLYRNTLPQGIMMARFLRWFETGGT